MDVLERSDELMLVLVTGAGGSIGSATSARLVEAGHRVRALVRVGDALPTGVDVELVRGDATDPHTVTAAVSGVDAVVHLAALLTPVGFPPERVVMNNCGATFLVLQRAAEAGVRRAVIASSISVLGLAWARSLVSPAYVPIDEEHPLWPEDPYALSKQFDECSAAMVHRRYGLTVLAYRFPLTASADTLTQRAHDVARDAAAGAKDLWAYLDVRDAAEAIRQGLESTVEGFHVMNIVAPETLATRPTMDLVSLYHPRSEVRRFLSGREVPYTTDRAEKLLGFRAHHLLQSSRANRATS